MKSIKVELVKQNDYIFSFDENSKEFNETLRYFKEYYNEHITIDDLLNHISYNLERSGDREIMIEGVGHLADEGEEPFGEPFSGIYIKEILEDDYEYNNSEIIH